MSVNASDAVHVDFDMPEKVEQKVYDLVTKVGRDGAGRLKKGMNEVIKVSERGDAKLVVMAANVNPPEMMMPIPMICKERGIPYIYVEDQSHLGFAAGMSETRQTSAVAVMRVDKGAQKDFDAIVKSANELAAGDE